LNVNTRGATYATRLTNARRASLVFFTGSTLFRPACDHRSRPSPRVAVGDGARRAGLDRPAARRRSVRQRHASRERGEDAACSEDGLHREDGHAASSCKIGASPYGCTSSDESSVKETISGNRRSHCRRPV
jgi:hypothetical protein